MKQQYLGNKGKRTIAKLMLNSLYGKFATSLEATAKIPTLSEGKVTYTLGEPEEKSGVYLPMACFITAYAREKTIRTSQAIKSYSLEKYGEDLYCYSDTDSIHTLLPIEELTKFCEIDNVELGKWKHESTFVKAKFVRQKTYLERIITSLDIKKLKDINRPIRHIRRFKLEKRKFYYSEIKITCAGLPQSCYKFVEWDKFKQGFSCGGKLMYHHVKGGVILKETMFTIKEDKMKKFIEKF